MTKDDVACVENVFSDKCKMCFLRLLVVDTFLLSYDRKKRRDVDLNTKFKIKSCHSNKNFVAQCSVKLRSLIF